MAKHLPENLIQAVNKYLEGTATPKEKEQIDLWYKSFNDEMVEVPSTSLDMKEQIDNRLKFRLKELVNKSYEKEAKVYPLHKTFFRKVSTAAAIVFIISIGTYFFLKSSTEIQVVKNAKPTESEIAGFENKVILTLQDGSKISLTDLANGEVIKQNGFAITKTADGEFTYDLNGLLSSEVPNYSSNKIVTPNGKQIQIKFPDGTQVWINASSSFRFPVLFSKNAFNTDLHGEAYFEVKPNKSRKFKVRAGNQVTEVLGTKFNIKTNQNDAIINTTLLEGSILITDLSNNFSQILKPGQQSVLNKILRVSEAEAQDVIAWTGGYFYFNNADIKSVMHDLERWYGITVRYEGELTKQKFEGLIDKKLSLQQVLAILEKSQIHFSINGKEVVVMP